MNNKIYRVIIDVINLILGVISLYAIMALILLLTKSSPASPFLFFLSLTGAVLSYCIQQYTRHMWSFLLLHCCLIAVFFLVTPTLVGKFLGICFMTAVTLYSLVKRLKEEEMGRKNISPAHLLILGLLYLVNLQLHLAGLNQLLFILTIIFILLFLINSYLINFEHYFSLQQETSNVPLKQIKTVNHTIIIFFLGLSFASMLAFTRLPLKNLLQAIQKRLLAIIRGIFSLLPGASSNVPQIQEAQQNAPTASPPPLPTAAPPSPFWQHLQNFILTLLTVAMVVAAIALISFAIYKLYQTFYKDKRNLFKDNTEFISPFDKREKALKEKPSVRQKGLLRFWSQTNNDKIRKAFYKAILAQKGKLPKLSATPMELSRHILSDSSCSDEDKEEKSESLAFYYEKARYNKEDCTKEDVEDFKNLLHRN